MSDKFKMLVLEDDPRRQIQFIDIFNSKDVEYTLVDNAKDCIENLKNNKYNVVFLDHDLGGKVFVSESGKNTGSEVARFLVSPQFDFEKSKNTFFVVHSLNPAGSKYMHSTLSNGGFQVASIPFVWDKEIFESFIKINN